MSPHIRALVRNLLPVLLAHLALCLPLGPHPLLREQRHTLEPCTTTSDCNFPRLCLTSTLSPCVPPAACVCLPHDGPRPCSASADCPLGEACAVGLLSESNA